MLHVTERRERAATRKVERAIRDAGPSGFHQMCPRVDHVCNVRHPDVLNPVVALCLMFYFFLARWVRASAPAPAAPNDDRRPSPKPPPSRGTPHPALGDIYVSEIQRHAPSPRSPSTYMDRTQQQHVSGGEQRADSTVTPMSEHETCWLCHHTEPAAAARRAHYLSSFA